MLGFGFGGLDMFCLIFWVAMVGLALWLVTLLFPSTRNDPGNRSTEDENGGRESPSTVRANKS